ncbi:uncharacterized membrane protein YoaT (DUF817 family) [Paenibacillus sp. LBL]|uniref:hypothetical protein n=1 Tax=Paenibacillus sp. LBL TaxID=2940563 RepID=UPI002473BA2F|nr:hypothetical protein [Paenibacillus sp. LBL]MDH6671995.1 uncharacterized membrane protein YoaT (DUF817 family) [Paenibacillus sp. LBL]
MTEKKSAKKLTTQALKKLESELNVNKTVPILNNTYEVNIQQVFRESRVEAVVIQYLALLQELKKRTDLNDMLIAGTVGLLNSLIIKEFTSIPYPQCKSIEDHIKVSHVLLDTGIMNEIFDSFIPEELRKIEDKFKSTNQNLGEILGELALSSSLE